MFTLKRHLRSKSRSEVNWKAARIIYILTGNHNHAQEDAKVREHTKQVNGFTHKGVKQEARRSRQGSKQGSKNKQAAYKTGGERIKFDAGGNHNNTCTMVHGWRKGVTIVDL